MTTIFEAVEAGDLEALSRLIASGADVNIRDAAGRTALQHAAARGALDVARALLDAGAIADASLPMRELPIPTVEPAPNPGASALARLFGEGREATTPGWTDSPGETPLATASALGHADVVRLLLDRGADVNGRGRGGRTALSLAVENGRREAMEALISRGADLEAKDPDGLTPLMLAARDGRLGLVRTLLDAGANPNAESETPSVQTPLSLAKSNRHTPVADALIAAGAISGHAPLGLDVALAEAVRENRVEVARSLIAAGAELNPQQGLRDYLHDAAVRGHLEMVRLLIGAGAALNARKWPQGTTPLMAAAEQGHAAAVSELLAAGAAVNAPIMQDGAVFANDLLNGSTALMLAARAGHPEVVRLLLEAGADRGATGVEGRTAAELAAAAGHDVALAALAEPTSPALRDARLVGAASRGDAAQVRGYPAIRFDRNMLPDQETRRTQRRRSMPRCGSPTPPTSPMSNGPSSSRSSRPTGSGDPARSTCGRCSTPSFT